MEESVIEVKSFRKTYGDFVADLGQASWAADSMVRKFITKWRMTWALLK